MYIVYCHVEDQCFGLFILYIYGTFLMIEDGSALVGQPCPLTEALHRVRVGELLSHPWLYLPSPHHVQSEVSIQYEVSGFAKL